MHPACPCRRPTPRLSAPSSSRRWSWLHPLPRAARILTLQSLGGSQRICVTASGGLVVAHVEGDPNRLLGAPATAGCLCGEPCGGGVMLASGQLSAFAGSLPPPPALLLSVLGGQRPGPAPWGLNTQPPPTVTDGGCVQGPGQKNRWVTRHRPGCHPAWVLTSLWQLEK